MAKAALKEEVDRRQAILDAALVLFSERGFHGTAVPEIAQRAGVATGTIYRYFESKEALVNELFQVHKTQLGCTLGNDFPYDKTPREQFHAFWRRYAEYAETHKTAFQFLELHHHAPYLDAKSHAAEETVLLAAKAYFEESARQGVIKPVPPAIAIAIVHGSFSTLVKAAWSDLLVLDDETLDLAEECVWDALKR